MCKYRIIKVGYRIIFLKGAYTVSFIESIKSRAKAGLQTIVLPESMEIRTLQATEQILQEGLAEVVLIGDPEAIKNQAGDLNIDGATIVNPTRYDQMDDFVSTLVDLRKKKGMTEEKAKDLLLNDPLYFGVMMVKKGLAGGMVAGAVNSTASVLRPSLQILKTAPGTKLVSSFFVMVVPDCDLGSQGTFVFSDCGLVQNPTADQLASIAGSSAGSFEALVGDEAVVGMLSHSTMGSASHPDVDKVVEATRLAKAQYPDYKIDGEFQLDAAIVPEIGAKKAPDSEVAGQVNVLVFPDLDAGNIGYKIVQRLAKAEAYGPVTQGIAKPVNDLSRGCSADDIVGVVAITAVQAQAQE